MFTKFLKIIFFILLLPKITFAEIVNQIKISGNLRISADTIKVLGNFDIGDDLNEQELNNVLKNLYSTDFFKDITLSLNNNILDIKISENPIIQSIFINGIKRYIRLNYV